MQWSAVVPCPEPSLVGWRVVIEPETANAERWTASADRPPGLVQEDLTLYSRSHSSGEVIPSDMSSHFDCELSPGTVAGWFRFNWG